MANELNVVETASVEVVETEKAVTPNYNKNLGDKVIKISIKCMTKEGINPKSGQKVKFNAIKGLKHLPVIDEDGVNIGKHNRWLDMHFTMDAFKTEKNKECEISDASDLKTGFLYVKAKFIDSPRVYKVKEDEETGEVKYPQIWIKGGIMGFEPYVSDQDEFDYVEPVKDAEIETNTLTDEPDDSEETTL